MYYLCTIWRSPRLEVLDLYSAVNLYSILCFAASRQSIKKTLDQMHHTYISERPVLVVNAGLSMLSHLGLDCLCCSIDKALSLAAIGK